MSKRVRNRKGKLGRSPKFNKFIGNANSKKRQASAEHLRWLGEGR